MSFFINIFLKSFYKLLNETVSSHTLLKSYQNIISNFIMELIEACLRKYYQFVDKVKLSFYEAQYHFKFI